MIVKSMGGISGIGALGIAALVTQVLMFALRSKLKEQAGAWRLAAVYFLTMVSGVIAMRMTGVDWGGALLHSNTLAAFQVFGHQVVSQAKDLKVDNKTVVEVKTDEPKPNPT
jgi:beta-lactamase regulating signal transducer with metallopeptidase domain